MRANLEKCKDEFKFLERENTLLKESCKSYGDISGNLNIENGFTIVKGSISGNVRAARGGSVILCGETSGNVIIEEGGELDNVQCDSCKD